MKKKLIALFMGLFLLGACKSEELPNENKNLSTNKIVVRVAQDPDFLDPHKDVAAATGEIIFNVFEGLVKFDYEGNIHPAIAESYEISNKNLTYTFKIKKGIKFHNGVDLTPELVKKSYDRFLVDNFPTNLSTREFKNNIKSIAVDGENVIFNLKQVSGDGITAFLIGIIYDDGEKVYGTGPYILDNYLPGEKVTLKKFKDYWNIAKVGNIEEVEYRIIKDEQTAVMSLQMGEVDIIHRMIVTYTDMIGNDNTLIKGEQNLVQLLALNNKIEPLNNKKVRQAIQLAVNKQEIIDGASLGEASVAGGPVSPAVKSIYNVETAKLHNYNIEKSKELLKEAGYEKGFEITLKAPANYQLHVDTSQIIKEQLAKVGIIVHIEEIEWATWLSDVYKARNYEMTVIGFEGKPSPYATLSRYVSTDPRNMVNFNNKKYDNIIKLVAKESDETIKTNLYKEAQLTLTENVGSVFLQAPNYIVGINKKISGFKIYPFYVLDMSLLNIND